MSRPRDPDIDQRVLDATVRLLGEGGYAAVSVPAVAAAAGVSKPAVYRRWPSRVHLVFAASTRSGVPAPLPDTGSVAEDLRLAVGVMAARMEGAVREVMGEQLGRMVVDEAFAREVCRSRLDPDRDQVLRLWERGVARGELRSEVDGREALDVAVGTCLYRILVRHEPADDAFVARLIEQIVEPARHRS